MTPTEAERGYDGMRRIPCLMCDWVYSYDPTIPGLREHAMRQGVEHYKRAHGNKERS